MAQVINQQTVLNSLHNLMGHRVNPGGTDDDLKRYIQESFNYCWRYYFWTFSKKKAAIEADGLLPLDFDHEGKRIFEGVTEVNLEDTLASTQGSAVVWDVAAARYKLEPAAAGNVVYQYTPPTLGTDAAGSAPFPSAQVVAVGATVYAKQADNPTRADVQQEWDMFHSELDRLVGAADVARSRTRTPTNRHSITGTNTGQV